MAITLRTARRIFSWQPHTINSSTILKYATNTSPAVTIGVGTMNVIQVFRTPALNNYSPYDNSTWSSEPLYSGNIYFPNTTTVTDVVEFIRYQLPFEQIFKNTDLPQDYHITNLTNAWYQNLLQTPKENISFYESNVFYVYISNTNLDALEINFAVIPDMSYEVSHYLENYVSFTTSKSILDIVAPSQYFLISQYNGDGTYSPDINIKYLERTGEYVETSTIDLSNTSLNADNALGMVVFIPDQYYNEVIGESSELFPYFDPYIFTKIAVSSKADDPTGETYKTYKVDPCIKYVLYYKNYHGGWDWLVVRGMVKKTIKSATQTYDDGLYYGGQSAKILPIVGQQSESSNILIPNSELGITNIYNNNITTELKINLGWFTDEQSVELVELFTSTKVYLHDLNDDKIIPITITSKSFDEKQYQENRTMNKYSLNATINQNKNIN